ncbi:MAG TPA: L-threonylcarbamoyladenylate synthase [Isosphaeraceae bacterium]|nr:L-threonylcarbamoyladenylate synthase [Isosphaeraceae bacterium]
MKTRVLQVDPHQPCPAALADAADVLSRGGLVAFATETVYGLGALATDPAAVHRIYHAKGRPPFNPLIVHVEGIIQARQCTAAWPKAADRLAGTFWPGPLTLVLERSSRIPDVVTGGRETVALRVPWPPVARGLIERVGQPLAAPSANRSNRLSPTRAEHVLADLDGRIDLILDSGPTSFGLESTVLDLTRSPLRILRPGPIGPEEIAQCLGVLDQVADTREDVARPADELPASPGMLDVHYAPRTPALRVDSVEDLAKISWPEQSAVLVLGPAALADLPSSLHLVELEDPQAAGQKLYSILHQLDALNLDVIVIVMPPDQPEWRTIRDRLVRAARPVTG